MRFFLLIIISMLIYGAGHGQSRFRFFRYATDNGLASNFVNATFRDEAGFLWISTSNGLQRFDGNKFITIKEYLDKSTLLPDKIDEIIAYDKQHFLFRSGARVGFFTPATFKYEPITVKTKTSLESGINTLFKDNKGRVFLSNSKEGLLVYDRKNNCFTAEGVPVKLPQNWPVTRLVEDRQRGNYWIFSDSGLAVFNAQENAVYYKNFNPGNNPLLQNLHGVPINLLIDSMRRYWIICRSFTRTSPEILEYNEGINQFVSHPIIAMPPATGYYDLTHLITTRSGMLWAGGQSALLNYDSSRHILLQNRSEHTDDYGIRFNQINHLAEDKEGGLWISTDNGLYVSYPDVISKKGVVFTQQENCSFTALLQVGENELWAGTRGRGIMFYDTLLKPIRIDSAYSQKYDAMPWCLAKQQQANLVWAGCQEGKIQVIDARTKKPLKLVKPAVFGGSTVLQIAEDRKGNLWFSTKSGTLVKWLKGSLIDNAHFTLVYDFNSAIDKLYIDKAGALWVATIDRGVYVIDPITEKIITNYVVKPNRETSLYSNTVSGIQQLNDSIYFINDEALSVLNKSTGRFKHLTAFDGLPGNSIRSMVLDSNNQLWLSTINGLCSYNFNTNRFMAYTKNSGLFYVEGMPASLKAQNGKVYFGSDNVLLGFNPIEPEKRNITPNVTITEFHLSNQWLPVDSLLALQQIKLPDNENSFSISFAALNFLQQNQLVYYYKLDGADKNWIRADRNLTATYNLLPPGSYKFLVRCENSDGTSGNDITQLSILIQVPFWLSWWFILLCCALFALAAYLVYQQQIKQFMMIEKVRQKVARDLHDDMGSTLSTINILSLMAKNKLGEDWVKTSEYLGKISDNSSRMMEAMDDIVWSINPANDSMEKTVARMRGFATEVLEARDIDFSFTISGDIHTIHLDMEQRRDLFLIYKEAVNNIAKYAHCKKVGIRLGFSQTLLVLQIEDDGIGFDVEKADSGNGLSNMRKRAENLGGTLKIESRHMRGTVVSLQLEIT